MNSECVIHGPAARALRLKSGFGVADFARDIPITPAHWSNIESGVRGASPKVIRRAAEILGVKPQAITTPPCQECAVRQVAS